jgi:RimJ/RimL family protein N-acetyltransferase/ketosteroid isomerase-like protein
VSGVRLRRADRDDLDFLLELFDDDDVRPYLAAGKSFDRETIARELERQDEDPDAVGRFVVELDGERAGTLAFERLNVRSRIARLGGLAVHPSFRGRRLADEAARLFQRHLIFDLGYHRLEMTVYGFNERAQRHAERAGWIREGVKRKAYRRGDEWVDGVMYAVLREDLEALSLLEDHVERFNAGVRSGDFAPMLENFADDATMAFEGVPVGPFAGKDAIARAYREQPPDDELDVLDSRHAGDTIVAAYAWRREPGKRAGELRLTLEGGRITRLVVTFDPP